MFLGEKLHIFLLLFEQTSFVYSCVMWFVRYDRVALNVFMYVLEWVDIGFIEKSKSSGEPAFFH